MCSVCKIRSHLNHEEHFVSIYDFKNDLLQYINERRQERMTLLNSFKQSKAIYKYSKLNQSSDLDSSSEQNVLINRATTSSPNQNELYYSLVKQLQKTEKLSEQFILEGLVNDIDSLINKIRKLNKTQHESIKASNELIQFNQTFQNIFKNFIQKKNLSEAKIFWSQHDLINEINCGLNDSNYEMSSQVMNSQQQQHRQQNRSLLLRQVLSKKNSRGLQTSASSYQADNCNQNQLNTQFKTKQKQQQPFMSLIKFFENFEHRIVDKIQKQIISQIYPIIYLNSNYCLIVYSTGYGLSYIGLYDLVKSILLKSQRIDLNQSGLQNFYEIGLFQFLDEEFHQQQYFHNQIIDDISMIQDPFIPEQLEETEIFEQQNIIQISDDDIQPNSNQPSDDDEIQSEEQFRQNIGRQFQQQEVQMNRQRSHSSEIQQDRINVSADEQVEEQYMINQDRKQRYIFQNNQKEDNSSSPSSQYSNNYEIDSEYSQNQYSANEIITINSVSRKTSSEISKDDIAVFSPIVEDTSQQDDYDSELDNLKNMFASHKEESLKEKAQQKNKNQQDQKNNYELDIQNDNALSKKNNKNNSSISKSINQYQEAEDNSKRKTSQNIYESSQLNALEEKQNFTIEESESEFGQESYQAKYKTKEQNVIVISDSESSSSECSDQEIKYKKRNKISKQKQTSMKSARKKPLYNIRESSDEDEEEEEVEVEEVEVAEEEEELVEQRPQYNQTGNFIQINEEENSTQNEQITTNYVQINEEESNYFDGYQMNSYVNQTNEPYLDEPIIESPPIQNFPYYQPFFFNYLDSSVDLNLRSNFNLLVRNHTNRIIQIEKSNLLFKKINFKGHQLNSDILVKEKTIYTKNQIKQVFSIDPLIVCVCEKKSTLLFLFTCQDQLTFYNTRTKKMIKKINNLEFSNENIKPLRLGKGNQYICFKTFKRFQTNHFVIYNWKLEKEVKRFELNGGATFENMRIFIEFYYQMYKDLDFDTNKVCLQIGDKLLQSTNFQENSLQYCIPYYCQNHDKKYYQLGICYLHNKMLKTIPFSIKHINLDQGISQMFISNDQLVIILKNGQIHHCHVKNVSERMQKGNQASPKSKKNSCILIN
ncbi:hypothetical protein ABPG74_018630 [Tetrahymena malaccensis]